jgi:tRNA modification GTPase
VNTAVADTIVAPATPAGRGGIAIVRLSGPLAEQISRDLTGRLPAPRLATLCVFKQRDGIAIDRGLVVYFPAPNSYTGESVLELQTHGSPIVVQMLMRRCLELGARMARPGEFSERAFLSGQLDLAQAEAVADLIESGTEAAAHSAFNALQGDFSRRVHQLVGNLTQLRIYVEAAMDFPDEEIDFLADQQVIEQLTSLQREFASLRRSMRQGKLLRDGLRVVLTGAPNAGKSSLLNLMTREQRAIVSDIPGTTRDVLEQHLDLDGLPVVLIDTAGIRYSADAIEVEGVRRAREQQQKADLVLLVSDLNQPALESAESLRKDLAGIPVVTVFNKIDLSGRSAEVTEDAIYLSALTGEGLDGLISYLQKTAGYRLTDSSQFIARQRHIDALDRAKQHLDRGVEQLQQFQAGELLAEELKFGQDALGEITGAVSSDDLLGLIFGSFCIGK